ncbi:heparan sulfate glucosamine 3-O-sulfotransferase 1-like [Amphiura filiformis]|uniref:heparan sulfate glucosamine 3-O-sulfotransferase 1-like n=1 Tax=Amphiura filiformis TaxID=82378 RepID=UPI003B215259
MPPVQGNRIDDVIIMAPNSSDPIMERKHSDKNRVPQNGHIPNGAVHLVEITPWPSGTPIQKSSFLCTMKRIIVFLISLLFFSTLLLLGGDSARVQFNSDLSPKVVRSPVGCYLKTADRQGYFALMEDEELEKRGCERRFPQAVISGTKKGGTTTLKYFLSYHPDVAMATKEMKFFNSNYKKGMDWYKENMPYSTETQVTIEKTPGYFVGHAIPERINSFLPDTKIIIIMRDPVKRAISDFVHMTSKINCRDENKDSRHCARLENKEEYKRSVNDTRTKVNAAKEAVVKSLESHEGRQYEIHKTFQESVLFPNGTVKSHNLLIDKGMYIRHLQYWFKTYQPDRMLLLDGETFITDPGPTLIKVEEFLGIRHYFTKDHFYFDEEKHFFCLKKPFRNCMSDSKGRDHPDVSDDVIAKLREFYRPYNEELARHFNMTTLWSS